MLSASRIQSFIDELLAAHGCYRPIDLLLKIGRLPFPRYEAWRHGELTVLEDGMAGNPEQIVALLKDAAACAGALGLQGAPEDYASRNAGRQDKLRIFRKSHHDQLARTTYQRADDSPQLNLFLDNRFPQARKRLCQALLERDTHAAESRLAEMAQADAQNDLQPDAEFAVDALTWLEQPSADPGGLLELMTSELGPRVTRLLGADAADFLVPFWRHLANSLPAERFDPEKPELHPSWPAAQIPEWPTVVESIRSTPGFQRHPELLARLATAALHLDDRSSALAALFRLCWMAPEIAEQWLEQTLDPALAHARDRFWDADPPFDTADFPAWLVATGHPVPDALPDFPDQDPRHRQRAFEVLRGLRARPDDMETRRWLHDNHPRLFQCWLAANR